MPDIFALTLTLGQGHLFVVSQGTRFFNLLRIAGKSFYAGDLMYIQKIHFKGLPIVIYHFLSRIKGQGHYDLEKFLTYQIFLHTVWKKCSFVEVVNI